MPQHFFRDLLLFLPLCAFAQSATQAQETFTITTVASPTEGGTITGAGTFPAFSAATITIQATAGWYISKVKVQPQDAFFGQFINEQFQSQLNHTGELVKFEGEVSVTADKEIDVEFIPFVPLVTSLTVATGGITNQTRKLTVADGSDVIMRIDALGDDMTLFRWLKDGVALLTRPSQGVGDDLVSTDGHITPGVGSSTLELRSPTYADRGKYSVNVFDPYGSTNSEEVELIVLGSVSAYQRPPSGGSFSRITNSIANFADSITIQLQASYPNALIFYTLDGSTPSFSSDPYTNPIDINETTVLRAMAYATDLSESAELSAITLTKQANVTLDLIPSSRGFTFVSKQPPYGMGDVVRLTADGSAYLPKGQFMGWVGSFTSTNNPLDVTFSSNVVFQAVFGTTVTVTPLGSGKITGLTNGTLVPLNDTIQFPLDAVPDPGFSFVRWGGAVAGTNAHAVLTNVTENTIVTALFAPLSTNEFSLTMLMDGVGTVGKNPELNHYSNGTSVIVTATLGNNQQFLGWTGSVTSMENPLSVSITSNMVVTAHFSTNLMLAPIASTFLNNRLVGFDVLGSANRAYRIEQSLNLHDWGTLVRVPALSGAFQPGCPFNPTNRAMYFRALTE